MALRTAVASLAASRASSAQIQLPIACEFLLLSTQAVKTLYFSTTCQLLLRDKHSMHNAVA
jgi:hypothetical protein